MRKLLLLSIILIGFMICPLTGVRAQGVGINPTGNSPHPSAGLDVDFNNKGTLITRLTTAQRDAISAPASGLLIFNTDCGNFNYYFNGVWLPLNNGILPAAAGTITGSATVCQGQNNVAYSVPAIANASSYVWAYSGTGATISGSTNSITINFSGTATSGNLSVMGTSACGNGTISANYAITVNTAPASVATASHIAATTQITWNWNAVSGAAGYKWGTTNVYGSATDNGASTSYTQTGLTCNTAYTLYIWAYNTCGNSNPTVLTQTSASCCSSGSITFNYTGSLQTWSIPACVSTVTITAVGGASAFYIAVSNCPNNSRGYGASITSTLAVTGGNVLNVLVAGTGTTAATWVCGGGGGSFVWDSNTNQLLIVAGGGGGGGEISPGISASVTTTPTSGVISTTGCTNTGNGAGGSGGNGGSAGGLCGQDGTGGGGAGWLSNGGNGLLCGNTLPGAGGKSPANGGAGGAGAFGDNGGYGGGGGASGGGGGGGGGYNGGGGGNAWGGNSAGSGGGGSSYSIAPITSSSVTNAGNGMVTITW